MSVGTSPVPGGATVFVLDGDDTSRRESQHILQGAGFTTRGFAYSQTFLEEYVPLSPACVVCEVQLPGMSGLTLQRELACIDPTLPMLFLTRHGSVAAATTAMKQGAVDFFEKPVPQQNLIRAAHEAAAANQWLRERTILLRKLAERVGQLSPREREVMEHVAEGESSKQVAAELHLSVRTVEHHRSSVMKKMQATNLVELIQMLALLNAPLPAADHAANNWPSARTPLFARLHRPHPTGCDNGCT